MKKTLLLSMLALCVSAAPFSGRADTGITDAAGMDIVKKSYCKCKSARLERANRQAQSQVAVAARNISAAVAALRDQQARSSAASAFKASDENHVLYAEKAEEPRESPVVAVAAPEPAEEPRVLRSAPVIPPVKVEQVPEKTVTQAPEERTPSLKKTPEKEPVEYAMAKPVVVEQEAENDVNLVLDQSEREAFLQLINRLREAQGARHLTIDNALNIKAHSWSVEMTRTGNFEHSTMGHPENIGMFGGGATPERAFKGWEESPDHYENMISPEHTTMGLGAGDGKVYWTLLFGRN